MQSEYGWSDDQVMDLPLCRLRQIMTAIGQRHYYANRGLEALTEWQTRALAHQIANLGRSREHARDMHDIADSYRITPAVQSDRPSEAETEGWTPDTPVNYDDPKFARNNAFGLSSLISSIERRRD